MYTPFFGRRKGRSLSISPRQGEIGKSSNGGGLSISSSQEGGFFRSKYIWQASCGGVGGTLLMDGEGVDG